MGAAFLITLREGLEAALIVSILLAYLRRSGRLDLARDIWWGVGGAAVVSLVAGGIIFGVGAEFDGTGEQVFEGLISLAAAAVLTWMIFWMRGQGARIRTQLQDRVDTALAGGGLALASLAFAVVVREGIETALFLFATTKATSEGGGDSGQLIGALLGLAVAVGLGYLVYRGGLRMNLKTFFTVTGGLLLVVAAGLVAFGVAELQEAGVLPFLTSTAYDVSATLTDESGLGALLRAVFGFQDAPSVLEVIVWAGYLVVAGSFFFRRPKKRRVADEDAQSRSSV